jgi:cation diffusion facilitator family transporter
MKKAEKAELVSIICSIFMAAGMLIAARLSGSVGILAEGIDTVVDIVASLAVLAGIKLSERRTRSFPEGLHKLENFIAVAIGIFILIGAFELGEESIGSMLHGGRAIEQPWLVIAVMGAVVLITGFLAWYKYRIGKEENSPSLQADARHSWTDVLASAGVIVGVYLQMLGLPHTDAVAALIVVAALAWSGIGIIMDGLRVLLDASLENEVIDQIQKCAEGVRGVLKVIRVDGRNSGSYRFVEITFEADTADLKEADVIAAEVRSRVRKEIEHVDRIDVEYAMESLNTLKWAVPLLSDGRTIANDLESASGFGLFEVDEAPGKVTRESFVQNPYYAAKDGAAIRAAVMLAKKGINGVLLKRECRAGSSEFIFGSNSIAIARLENFTDIETARNYLTQ